MTDKSVVPWDHEYSDECTCQDCDLRFHVVLDEILNAAMGNSQGAGRRSAASSLIKELTAEGRNSPRVQAFLEKHHE